jgi:UDP-glucuronate decarboxylase
METTKTVLIAGGAGFIGSHLCAAFLQKGWQVVCVDSFLTGSKNNIAPFIGNKKFRLITQDIIESLDIKCDVIFNLACAASPVHYQADPVHTLKTCVLGTLNLLELARKYHASLIQASTSEVYGDPLVSPQPESYWGNVNTVGVRSCYDEGKRAAETLCRDFAQQYGCDTRIVRIFNTYGPQMAIDDGRAVSNFVTKAIKGEDIHIYGDGRQTRSFCYVDDLRDGLIKISELEPRLGRGPYNLGNDREMSISELAALTLKLTGSKSRIVYTEALEDDPKCRRPDLTKTRSVMQWQAQVPLEEGLSATIEYFTRELQGIRKVAHEGQSYHSHL